MLSVLWYPLKGAVRFHTPSGIMDYMAGQYSVSEIDTPTAGYVLTYSEKGDFLAAALVSAAVWKSRTAKSQNMWFPYLKSWPLLRSLLNNAFHDIFCNLSGHIAENIAVGANHESGRVSADTMSSAEPSLPTLGEAMPRMMTSEAFSPYSS